MRARYPIVLFLAGRFQEEPIAISVLVGDRKACSRHDSCLLSVRNNAYKVEQKQRKHALVFLNWQLMVLQVRAPQGTTFVGLV